MFPYAVKVLIQALIPGSRLELGIGTRNTASQAKTKAELL